MEEETTTTPVQQQSYWGFDDSKRFYFPDGVTYVDIKVMTEGDRRRYLDKTANNLRVEKDSGDALIGMTPGSDRVALLVAALTGWNLIGPNGEDPWKFTQGNLQKFLDKADPSLIDDIEQEVRLTNPWLMADVSVEDLEKQIDQLQELLDKKREEEEGKDD